jgi:predicted kinase
VSRNPRNSVLKGHSNGCGVSSSLLSPGRLEIISFGGTTRSVPWCRVLVAAPATGKSTWCREQGRVLGKVLSTDAARAELGVGEHDQSVSAAAFDHVESRAAAHLAAGHDVTIDATGTRPEDRDRWLRLAAEYGAVPVAVRLRCSLRTALRRNHGRTRRVPVLVLVRMWWIVRSLTPGRLLAEGFVDVQDLRTDGPAKKASGAHRADSER